MANPAFRLLVACADWPRSDSRRAAICEAAAVPGAAGSEFLTLVDRHRMAPLALDGLIDAGVNPPDGLSGRARRDKVEALKIAVEGRRLIELFASLGIEAIMLKGPLLGQLLYGDIAMRQSIDLDLLVDWRDFEDARRIMGEQGYQIAGAEPPWRDWRIELWRVGAKDLTLVNRKRGTRVELHHRLKTPSILLEKLTIARADIRIPLVGTTLRTFGPSDLFVYLCVHEANTLWHRLKWLADLRALLSGYDEAAIERLMVHARGYGVERCTALALLLCGYFWEQDLPESVTRLAQDEPRLARLQAASLQVLAEPEDRRRSFGQTRTTMASFQLRDDWAYRRAALVPMLFEPAILAQYSLPRVLSFLYLPLRVLSWCKRRIRRADRLGRAAGKVGAR